ncbi:AI-2E family transporter [Halosimplex litoreum]|uniref:AI-2E family transporter n=1 Tax=Halosimplex litoreum TaxID=1198301 RepID=A0A7T3KV34_9EURY|nr:AI-2E family transporter [Halosimplex litoreum]QPV62415.1 AI-2E family transporter [Halosimplex litoreum]
MAHADTPMPGTVDDVAPRRLAWWVLGLGLLGVLAFVALRFLPWLVFGLFIYYVSRPITRRLESRVGSPGLVAMLTLLLIVLPVVLLLGALLVVAAGQFASALANVPLEDLLGRLPVGPADLPDTPTEVYDVTVTLIRDPSVQAVVGSVTGLIGAVGATLYNVFVSLLIGFFLLVSDRGIAGWFESEVFGEDSLAVRYLSTVDEGLRSIFFGYTLTILAIVVLTSVIYTAFDLLAPGDIAIPSIVLLAVVTGVFTLVPLVGRSIVYFLIAGVMAAQAATTDPRLLWYPVLFLAVMMLAFDNVVRTYIRPYLSGRMFNTGLVMFAYLFGPALFGWYGIFLGPVLLVFVVVFMRLVLPLLANPDRELPPAEREVTLDEFTSVPSGSEGPGSGAAEPE